MTATVKAKFDGKQFLRETLPALEAGRSYILHMEEINSEDRARKIAALREAVTEEEFLKDLEEVATDFAGLDSED
jgi:hypothetical protein